MEARRGSASRRRLLTGTQRARRGLRRRVLSLRRRGMLPQPTILLALVLLTALYVPAAAVYSAQVAPSLILIVVITGAYFLRFRYMVLLVLMVALGMAAVGYARSVPSAQPLPLSAYISIAATTLIALAFSLSRERLGLQGGLGASMLVDLRDRLRAQADVEDLPAGWQMETALRSAYGQSFSGDFLVASRSVDRTRLELVLVDVSGKGHKAGTRALLLSGAFGGLLGAMEPGEFLPAANAYLLRQRWSEGFATAVHVALDLDTGAFRLAAAGHPPPIRLHAGSGLWQVFDGPSGPLLGVVRDAAFPCQSGVLRRGDALLLYTDGLIETPDRDLSLGLDRLIGLAERHVVQRGFRGAADRLVDQSSPGESDDRSLVVLWRG